MSVFTTEFNTTEPIGTDKANEIATFIRTDAKAAINERSSLEHYNLETGINDTEAAGGQGRHIAGKVGIVLLDTLVNIQAVSGAGIGAMGIATDTGELLINTASGWVIQQFGAGTIYATDEEAAAGVIEDRAINPKQLQGNIWVPEYVEITGIDSESSGSINLTESTSGTYTYILDDLEGTGLVHDNIYAIYVKCFCSGNRSNSILATYPEDISTPQHIICANDGQSGVYAGTGAAVVRIPVSDSQIHIKLTLNKNVTCTTTILAVDQRIY